MLDHHLFPAGPGDAQAPRVCGVALVRRTLRYRFAFAAGGHPTLPRFLRNRTAATKIDPMIPFASRVQDLRVWRRLGIAGGIEHIHVDLVRNTAGKPVGWRVEIRQILVVLPNRLDAILAAPQVQASVGAVVRVQGIAAPTRTGLVGLLGGVLRYPRFLLDAEPRYALAYLASRADYRLSTRFGCCHGIVLPVPEPR